MDRNEETPQLPVDNWERWRRRVIRWIPVVSKIIRSSGRAIVWIVELFYRH